MVPGCCAETNVPVLSATRVADGDIEIDGVATEAAWRAAPVATEFTQFEPNGGDPASEDTEARVLYGDAALYVYIRAYDSSPEEIAGQLTRRDQESYSDLVGVVIDSYFDRRTAFQFVVNPVGVKQDVYRFDDTGEDSGWDAVWDAASVRDSEGWSAEFRIPYSQLRFRDRDEQTWGINFIRYLARREELSAWAPTTQADGGIVSRFGELRGLRNIDPPRRLEILPYSVARLERAPGDKADPFYRPNNAFGTMGADIKYGLASDITLDVTLNPDFGQIEADPAQVNLTAFETFFPERRPFFLEGAGIFNFGISLGDGDDATESLFYSRRVGRAPQGWADPRGGYADADDQTTILGAWKLSGKTANGWSIGAMHAVTSEETAEIAPAAGGRLHEPAEPFSNYGVLRLQKDFSEGRSAVGLIGTTVRRSGSVSDDLRLRSGSYAGGIDFRHRFGGDAWQLDGYLLGSYVQGSSNAIAGTQRSPARYFQRPDADHVAYDPGRTALSGGSANLAVMKFAGSPWRFGTGVQTRTPGFEVNDLGYQRDADYLVHWVWGGYHRTAPQGPFRSWFLNFNAWNVWNYGKDRLGSGGNLNANVQFRNFWYGYAGVNQELSAYSDGLLRGGPLLKTEAQTNFWGGFGSDSRKPVSVNFNSWGNVRPESDSWSVGFAPSLRVRPSARATFRLGTMISRNVDDRQWVRRIDTEAPNYLFARINQTTVGLTVRGDYAFTPDLSLQVYAQPFVGSGNYREFKRVADPHAEAYAARFEPVAVYSEDGRYLAELDGSRIGFGTPDFNFKQFRSNAVLRWEYRPGSVLYLVWSQGRNHSTGSGQFDFNENMADLFGVVPDNVFMVKLSYWLSR